MRISPLCCQHPDTCYELTVQVRAYKVKSWDDTTDFLTQLARNSGKLLRGGEPDLNTAARMVLYDWQRGKIPYFALPPDYEERASDPSTSHKPSQAVTVSACHIASAHVWNCMADCFSVPNSCVSVASWSSRIHALYVLYWGVCCQRSSCAGLISTWA